MPEKPNAPVWLKVVLAFHVFAITVWALPMTDLGKAQVGTDHLLAWNQRYLKPLPPVQAYTLVTGFWQYWDMFSPNPASIDIWVDAEITYKDGKVKWYHYPRMYDLPINEKFLRERYRKIYERVNEDKNSFYWPIFAQRIALLNDDPKNPPVKVRLRRHWLKIVGPKEKQTDEYNSYIYYEHFVDPQVLEAGRKGIW